MQLQEDEIQKTRELLLFRELVTELDGGSNSIHVDYQLFDVISQNSFRSCLLLVTFPPVCLKTIKVWET
jgi:hypothetical protein